MGQEVWIWGTNSQRFWICLPGAVDCLSVWSERALFQLGSLKLLKRQRTCYLHNRPKHEWLTDNWVKDTWDLIRPPNGKSGEIAKQKPLQRNHQSHKTAESGVRGSGIDLVVGGPRVRGIRDLGTGEHTGMIGSQIRPISYTNQWRESLH